MNSKFSNIQITLSNINLANQITYKQKKMFYQHQQLLYCILYIYFSETKLNIEAELLYSLYHISAQKICWKCTHLKQSCLKKSLKFSVLYTRNSYEDYVRIEMKMMYLFVEIYVKWLSAIKSNVFCITTQSIKFLLCVCGFYFLFFYFVGISGLIPISFWIHPYGGCLPYLWETYILFDTFNT